MCQTNSDTVFWLQMGMDLDMDQDLDLDIDTNHCFAALPASNDHRVLRAQRFPAAVQKANPHVTRYGSQKRHPSAVPGPFS